MGHVVDRWTVPGPDGHRVKGPRHGHGQRWLARWTEPTGREASRAFPSKDAALGHLARVSVDTRAGSYVTRSDVTFQQYAETWLGRQVHQRPSTAAQAASRLRVHAYPALGHLRVDQVTRGHVQDLVAAVPLAPSSTRTLYAYVRAVFGSAVEDRLIPVTPCRRIRLPQVPRRTLEPLTVEEVAAIAAAVPPRLAAMVWLGAGTGWRPGELRGLTVDRVRDGAVVADRQLLDDSRAGTPVWGPLKTPAAYRTTPLANVTWQRLQEHLAAFPAGPGGLVFASARGGPLRRNHLDYAWKAAGARGRGWHELRHHNASLLIAAGLSPRAVADRLGHADPSVTLATYAHLWPTDSVRMLEAIEAAHSTG